MTKVKLSKNPENIYNDFFIEDYIENLMYNDQMDKLPTLLMDYFILKLLYDEVMEGGFEQFIYNQYDYFKRNLKKCFERVINDELRIILNEYLSLLDKTKIIERRIENEEMIEEFRKIDDKFAELDGKINILKVFKSEYKINYGDNQIYLEIDKPKESSNLKFFKWTKKGCTIEKVCESIKNILAYFKNNKFDIYVDNMLGYLHITIKCQELLELDNFINEWNLTDKSNVCYFEIFSIRNIYDDDKDVIRIWKSGLERNEYFIERIKREKTKLTPGSNYSEILLFNDNTMTSDEDIRLFYNELNKLKNELTNINKVSCSGSSSNINDLIKSMSNIIRGAKSFDEIDKDEILKLFNK